MGASNSSVWPNLRALWNSIVQKRTEEKDKGAHRRLCVALAKFTRNLVAGVQENQDMALCAMSPLPVIHTDVQ